MWAREYIRGLGKRGRRHFWFADAQKDLPHSAAALRAQLRRLKDHGDLAEPKRNFFVIVPPEYQTIGCLPAVQFVPQMMDALGRPYYFALLSAAQHHGASHQKPLVSQVITNTKMGDAVAGQVRVKFIVRKDAGCIPTVSAKTPNGPVRFSTPEVTALELVGYPLQAGGLSNVATILSDLVDEIAPDKLAVAAETSPVSWSQRLGYLFEHLGLSDHAAALRPLVSAQAKNMTPLLRTAPTAGSVRSKDWKLIINTEVDPDV